jgi:hypothetical protein
MGNAESWDIVFGFLSGTSQCTAMNGRRKARRRVKMRLQNLVSFPQSWIDSSYRRLMRCKASHIGGKPKVPSQKRNMQQSSSNACGSNFNSLQLRGAYA